MLDRLRMFVYKGLYHLGEIIVPSWEDVVALVGAEHSFAQLLAPLI